MALTAEQRQSYGEHYIQKAFQELVGRAPTTTEIAEIFPSFGSDPNIHDTTAMRARVAEYAQRDRDTKKPDEDKKKFEEDVQANVGSAADIIKNTLGRDATKEESDHFARLKASGFDDYSIVQALQSLPEYTQKQDSAARESLRGELATGDQQFFENQVMPSIQSRFAQQGRSVDSSGYASALANVAKDMQSERSNYLAGIGRDDYTFRRQQAIDGYMSNLSRNYAQQDYSRMRADQLSDVYRQRSFDVQDYDVQKRAYDEYLRNNGVRKKGGGALMGGLQGAMSGAVTGFMMGGPWGALAGGVAGGGMGAYGGAQQDKMYSSY